MLSETLSEILSVIASEPILAGCDHQRFPRSSDGSMQYGSLGKSYSKILSPEILFERQILMAMHNVSLAAIRAVLRAQNRGELQWTSKLNNGWKDFSTEAIVKNGFGQDIAVPVRFLNRITRVSCYQSRTGYLMLGNGFRGLTITTREEWVWNLYQQLVANENPQPNRTTKAAKFSLRHFLRALLRWVY